MKEAQIISDGEKMALVMYDRVIIIQSPLFNQLEIDFNPERINFMDGSSGMSYPHRTNFELSFSVGSYHQSENINKELLDFGLVNQMTVNQLFKEINKKLDKRK